MQIGRFHHLIAKCLVWSFGSTKVLRSIYLETEDFYEDWYESIYTLTNSFTIFVPTFTTPDCPPWLYWTNFPPYCFLAKIIPRLHSSYMFHQSCAFCFVLILPLAPSGKYLYITSLKLWLLFLVPGPRLSFQGSTSLIHFSIYQFIHSVFPIDNYLIHGVQLGLDVV